MPQQSANSFGHLLPSLEKNLAEFLSTSIASSHELCHILVQYIEQFMQTCSAFVNNHITVRDLSKKPGLLFAC